MIAGGIAFFIFHNYRQEQQVKRFFALLETHEYQAAYELWVRTDGDRRGIRSPHSCRIGVRRVPTPDVANFRISRSRSCGSGVILTVDFGKNQQEKLWVERDDLTIGFSPLPGCPAPR